MMRLPRTLFNFAESDEYYLVLGTKYALNSLLKENVYSHRFGM